jgi:hypothetical protein
MKLIVPMCGKSSRYPGKLPKWMLPAYDGMPMIYWALAGLEFERKDLIFTVLSEHNKQFGVVNGLGEIFGKDARIITLDQPTRSQAETVSITLEKAEVNEAFFVKDSDNGFELANLEQSENYVSVASLNDFDMINPRNKSYVQVDRRDQIVNIREKVVISDLFSVGGYYFSSSDDFRRYYRKLSEDKTDWQTELYISDIIGAMLLDGVPFRTQRVSKYQDWGTIAEWEKALLSRKTYFILLDGFLFERGSNLFSPRFQDVKANESVVDAVKHLVRKGNKIIFISIRDRSYKDLTESQLDQLGLPNADIVFDCPVSQYVMITSGHSTLPFQTSLAMEIAPDDTFSLDKII